MELWYLTFMDTSVEFTIHAGQPCLGQIRDQLRMQIRSRRLQPGQRIPSIREISKACGVSTSIVKQAISTLSTEGYLTSERGRGVFVAQPRSTQRMIAMVLPSFDLEQMAAITRGAKAGLGDSGGRLIVQAADYSFTEEINLIESLDLNMVMGAILYPPPMNEYVPVLKRLAARGIPYVLIHTELDGLSANTVQADRFSLGKLAFDHILAAGHRRIGVVDHNGDAATNRRLRDGADQALRAYGMRLSDLPRYITDASSLNAKEPWHNGELGATELLNQYPDITAIIGMNDHLSMGAYCAASKMGRRIPEDISIMAIGDLKSFLFTDPPITAVAQPHETIGYEAARRLIDMLNGQSDTSQAIRLAPHLIERMSVSAPRPVSDGAIAGTVMKHTSVLENSASLS